LSWRTNIAVYVDCSLDVGAVNLFFGSRVTQISNDYL
jgi:hypothetical protein